MPRVRTARQEAAHKARRRRRQYPDLVEVLVRWAARGLRLADLPHYADHAGRTTEELSSCVAAFIEDDDGHLMRCTDGVLHLTPAGRERYAEQLRRGQMPAPKGGPQKGGPQNRARGGRKGKPVPCKPATAHGKAPIDPPSPPDLLPTRGPGRRPEKTSGGAQRSAASLRAADDSTLRSGSPSSPRPAVVLDRRIDRHPIYSISGPRLDGATFEHPGAAPAQELWRNLPFGESVFESVIPSSGDVLRFHADRTPLNLKLLADDKTELFFHPDGRVRLRMPRDAVWGMGPGFEVWLRKWLDAASTLILGSEPGGDIPQAYHLGWRTTSLDPCADFTGRPNLFRLPQDAKRWMADGRKLSFVPEPVEQGHGYTSMHRRKHGKGGADLSLCVQNKSAIIREVDKHEPNASPHYCGPWLESRCWDGYSEVWRVEFRVRRSALWRRGLDLRDPANINPATVRLLFDDAMRRYALLRPNGTVDPRWRQLRQAAAVRHVDLGPPMASPSRLTDPERAKRHKGRLLGVAAQLVTLSTETPTEHDVIDTAKAALALVRAQCKNSQ